MRLYGFRGDKRMYGSQLCREGRLLETHSTVPLYTPQPREVMRVATKGWQDVR